MLLQIDVVQERSQGAHLGAHLVRPIMEAWCRTHSRGSRHALHIATTGSGLFSPVLLKPVVNFVVLQNLCKNQCHVFGHGWFIFKECQTRLRQARLFKTTWLTPAKREQKDCVDEEPDWACILRQIKSRRERFISSSKTEKST